MRRGILLIMLAAGLASGGTALALERFPPPDFESGYGTPPLTFQQRPTAAEEIAFTVLLAAVLPTAGWALLRRRSRWGVALLGVWSLLFFGFYKQGCICPIGSVQNVALALLRPEYAVPRLVVITFMLPLVFALICGRVFCGAVCPLGMIQDVFLFRPVHTPRGLDGALGLLRFFILGIALYVVAEESRFRICQLDPFVGFFRMSGTVGALATGAGLLAVGLFIGRPFCRYLCPYGGLLSLLSRWTMTGVRVTPDECIKCTLCDDACPFGAIRRPTEETHASPRLKAALYAASALIVPGLGGAGYLATGSKPGLWLGVWFGVVIASHLISLSVTRERVEYEVDHAACMSCGRCYEYCPRGKSLRAPETPAGRGHSEVTGSCGR